MFSLLFSDSTLILTLVYEGGCCVCPLDYTAGLLLFLHPHPHPHPHPHIWVTLLSYSNNGPKNLTQICFLYYSPTPSSYMKEDVVYVHETTQQASYYSPTLTLIYKWHCYVYPKNYTTGYYSPPHPHIWGTLLCMPTELHRRSMYDREQFCWHTQYFCVSPRAYTAFSCTAVSLLCMPTGLQ